MATALNHGSSQALLNSSHLRLDQKIIGNLAVVDQKNPYYLSMAGLIELLCPAQRTWVVSPGGFLEYLGFSGKGLRVPNIVRQSQHLSREQQIDQVVSSCKLLFGREIETTILPAASDLLFNQYPERIKNPISKEILELHQLFYTDTSDLKAKLATYLALDFAQNLDWYSFKEEDAFSFILDLMVQVLNGGEVPLFRLLMDQRVLRFYQHYIEEMNLPSEVADQLPYLSSELPGLKLRGDRLDCELIHFYVTDVPPVF